MDELLRQSADVGANAQKVLLGQEFKFNDGRWRQLTLVGDNQLPSAAKTGDQIVFVSAGRNAHANNQVYLFDLQKNLERRVTFSDGEAPEAVIANGDIFYVSDTEVVKERPPVLNGTTRDNDVFRLRAQEDIPERLTMGERQHSHLALGKSSILWSAGAEEKQVYAFGNQGASPLNTIPTGAGVRVQVDPVKGYWAWILQRKGDSKSRLFVKDGDRGKIEEVPLEVTDMTTLHWWSLASGSYLWIERRAPAGLESVTLYDPAKKCAGNVAVEPSSPKNGPLHSIVPFRTEGGFLAVVGTSPRRQIYQSTENLGKGLIKALENGMPCSGAPLTLD